nr:PTS glucose transporter subunit IIA [Bowmanella dokdonensis]
MPNPNLVVLTAPESSKVKLSLLSPVSGTVMTLHQLESPLYSSGLMGLGVGIAPSGYKLLAPFEGRVSSISPTREQIRLRSRQGLDLLLQVGLDSHKLMTQGFRLHCQPGDKIESGQLLLEFDLTLLRERAISPLCLVLIPQLKKLQAIQAHCFKVMAGEDPCMTLHF